jgi:hypothetical protein
VRLEGGGLGKARSRALCVRRRDGLQHLALAALRLVEGGRALARQGSENWGKNVTLLSSMSMEGMGPSVAVAGATTRAVFEASTSSRRSPRACAPGRWWSWTTSLPTREGG